jgi:hypothetical protein
MLCPERLLSPLLRLLLHLLSFGKLALIPVKNT